METDRNTERKREAGTEISPSTHLLPAANASAQISHTGWQPSSAASQAAGTGREAKDVIQTLQYGMYPILTAVPNTCPSNLLISQNV